MDWAAVAGWPPDMGRFGFFANYADVNPGRGGAMEYSATVAETAHLAQETACRQRFAWLTKAVRRDRIGAGAPACPAAMQLSPTPPR